jgi:uncharacterized damage-inducible protein DinB
MSVFTNPASGSAAHASAYVQAVLGLLGAKDPIAVLEQTEAELRRALAGLTPRQVAQREAPGKWAVRHVVQHLADSELVWGYRLRMVLAQDRPPLTGYDQDAWAERLEYGDSSAERALEEFAVLRNSNLRLVRRATPRDLERVGVHAERGEESVQHMMRLYAGHDILHLRQIDRIRQAVGATAPS